MGEVTERTVAATVHGRYLVIPPAHAGPAPVLVGFHGYGEDAEAQLERLRAIPESTRWLCVSIQALHPFYQRRTDRVIASWMTRQDRDLAITDNTTYVRSCIEVVAAEWPTIPNIVFAGFSQGVAMAFRAAVDTIHGVASVIAVGGDVPPELTPEALKRVSAVLLARGTSDDWYTKEQFANDKQRLRDCSVSVRALTLNAGHEWSSDLIEAASQFLRERYPSVPRSRVEYCWNPADKSRLVKMVEEGCDYNEIAAQIGRTAAACKAMYNLVTKKNA
jgi:predicted esterase